MDHETPENLLYTPNHEWLRRDDERPDEVTVGITDYAQDQVGDVVYLDLPGEGDAVTAGERCGEIESAKTVSDLYAPVSGEVVAANAALEDQPELVNASPFDEGWMVRLRMSDEAELEGLLDAGAYRAQIPEH
ncbi:MAG: glycine cleavage system protein GcvH [Dehalococcoidia bacterium]|nr:glycine cleavage system protein GcvH [Chloroflexota bacterium]MXW24913.1 glycine cleavage system protein GcvH [Dehalococcoidia bacterium]MYA54132.1 glycine cleavage system protein GcvH [Dehalococcoidia bacterium]MYH67574.1 glycine cleavage system protein GcvH [Dehalococcoidia bacterium]